MKKFLALTLMFCLLLTAAPSVLAEALEPVEIEMANWDIVEYGDDTLVGKQLAEKFNWKFSIRNLDWNTYADVIAMWGSTDDLPDIINGRVTEKWFINFIAEDLVKEIPLEMLQKYDKLYKIWQSDAVSQFLYKYYGKIYYYPTVDSMTDLLQGTWVGGAAMYYRKDWAEKLGIAKPTNLDELQEMLIAFAQKDPDGNGVADTYGLNTTFGRMEGLFSWFNAFPNFWVKTEAGYMPGYLDREPMLDALTWMRKTYENGGLDPEFKADFSAFTSGVFGARVYHSNPGWASNNMYNFVAANPDGTQDPFAVMDSLVALPRHAGDMPTVRTHYNNTVMAFTYKCTDAAMDRFLNFLNWAAEEPDGTWGGKFDDGTYFNLGVEGVDWKFDEQGILRYLTDADNTSWGQRNPAHMLARLSWGFDSEFKDWWLTGDQTVEMTRKFQELGQGHLDKINAAAANPAITFSLEASLISTDEKAEFLFDHMTALVQIVSGTEDVTAMYDAFVKSAYDYGVQGVIDSVTEALSVLE